MPVFDDLRHVGLKGSGYFCNVIQYTDDDTGKNYAVKELKKEHYANPDYRYRLSREIKLLEELQGCKNIIKLIGHGNDKEKERLWYMMPFAKHNLYRYIKEKNSSLVLADRFNLAEQVISAIKYAHERNILHRDISPNNALVLFREGNPIIKVSDFGLGKDTESLSYYTGSSAAGYGQILYVSPEQRTSLKDATARSDIYSLGKLVYFIFTGKDPDNMRPFGLSTLVIKATDENPDHRFRTIDEFETHFLAQKELLLNATIPVEYITLKEVLQSEEEIDVHQLHQLLVKGVWVEHVYSDYIEPVNKFMLKGSNLKDYYAKIGNGIITFITTYVEKLNECYQTTRWPFPEMTTFGEVLRKIIETIPNDECRLICLKELWNLGYVNDQWSVQKEVKRTFTDKYITASIETQLAESIIEAEVAVDITEFSGAIPRVVKIAIIKAKEIAEKKVADRKKREADDSFEY